MPVTVSEATLGAKVEVPTIDGRSLVRIPPGTNSGRTLRLREKGVPNVRNGARGDQYVYWDGTTMHVADKLAFEMYYMPAA